MAAKKRGKATMKAGVRKRQTVGESIIQGLYEAIAWTRGESANARVEQDSEPNEQAGKRVLRIQ